jgi:hypothetical protein
VPVAARGQVGRAALIIIGTRFVVETVGSKRELNGIIKAITFI